MKFPNCYPKFTKRTHTQKNEGKKQRREKGELEGGRREIEKGRWRARESGSKGMGEGRCDDQEGFDFVILVHPSLLPSSIEAAARGEKGDDAAGSVWDRRRRSSHYKSKTPLREGRL
ncbi:hypothetical protein HN51_011029 [Arachis hypogaea]|nr:uncharacterized protein DS421_3g72100 [Arachis hypogaea]